MSAVQTCWAFVQKRFACRARPGQKPGLKKQKNSHWYAAFGVNAFSLEGGFSSNSVAGVL